MQPGKKIIWNSVLILLLCVAISFYESAANLYLFGVLLILFFDVLQKNQFESGNIKNAVFLLGHTVFVLVMAILGRTFITRFTMKAFSLPEYFFRSVTDISWLSKGTFEEIYADVVMLIKALIREYYVVGVAHYPIFLFTVATILFVLYVIYKTIRDKNIWLFLYGLGAYATFFILTIIQGETLKYRSCQTFSVFVSVIMMVLTYRILKQKWWQKVAGMAVIFAAIIYSAVDLNGWFVYDYEKTQVELEVVREIGHDLQNGGYDIQNKPVVFVGDFYLEEEILDKCYVKKGEWGYPALNWINCWMELEEDAYCVTQTLDMSLIEWSIESLASYGGYNKPLQNLFEYCGYSFVWAESELYEEIMPIYYSYYGPGFEYMKTEAYDEEEQYPYDGYIEETEDYIVVKL